MAGGRSSPGPHGAGPAPGLEGPLEQPGHPGKDGVPSSLGAPARPRHQEGGTQPGGREEAQLPLLTRRPAAAGSLSLRGLGPSRPSPEEEAPGLFLKPARLPTARPSPPPPPSGQDAWLWLTDFTSGGRRRGLGRLRGGSGAPGGGAPLLLAVRRGFAVEASPWRPAVLRLSPPWPGVRVILARVRRRWCCSQTPGRC